MDPSARSLSQARLYRGLTVAWNMSVGAASFVVGAAASSLELIAFGLNAAVDSIASATLVWRFGQERKHAERGDDVERTALCVVGVTLVAISLYLLTQGIRSLVTRSHPVGSAFGVALAAASLLVLPPLAYRKIKLADVLKSRARWGLRRILLHPRSYSSIVRVSSRPRRLGLSSTRRIISSCFTCA